MIFNKIKRTNWHTIYYNFLVATLQPTSRVSLSAIVSSLQIVSCTARLSSGKSVLSRFSQFLFIAKVNASEMLFCAKKMDNGTQKVFCAITFPKVRCKSFFWCTCLFAVSPDWRVVTTMSELYTSLVFAKQPGVSTQIQPLELSTNIPTDKTFLVACEW